MLFFAPVRFDDEIAILCPADAFAQLARAYCATYPPEAHHHSHPDYSQVIALTNRASEAIKCALEEEELSAFAILQDGHEFFRVPGEYWRSTTSYLLGKIFELPADGLVPPQFQDARVVIRRDDWLTWLSKAGVELPLDHGVPLAVAIGRLVQPDDFDPNAPAEVAPWWSVLQAIGWIATASRAYVSHLGSLESERNDEIQRTITFSAFEVYVRHSHCKCGAQGLPPEVRWEYCTCPGEAGRSLLEAIRLARVAAIDRSASPARRLEFFELAGIGQRSTCADWLALGFNPVFSSADVIAAFPGEKADDSSSLARAMTALRPAVLEGKGPVIGLDQAASLLAYGKLWNDAFLTNNNDGNLNIMMSNGEPLVFNYGTDLDWRQTNLLLHTALTSGDLPSYVAADDGIRPLVVPRYYWSQIPPTYVNPVFKGVDPTDPGISKMILLSRSEFDEWRNALPPANEPDKVRPSHGDVVQWCKDWIESGKGNGTDKAWLAFHAESKHRGLSRDDVFRPAWREAKTR